MRGRAAGPPAAAKDASCSHRQPVAPGDFTGFHPKRIAVLCGSSCLVVGMICWVALQRGDLHSAAGHDVHPSGLSVLRASWKAPS